MKILTRTEFGNPILRQKAKTVPLSFLKSTKGKELIKRMIYTMRRAHGVGLAAPQIGESIRLAVMEIRTTPDRPDQKKFGPIVVANPRIIKKSKQIVKDWEGCLSLKGLRGMVPRSKTITVEYYNRNGEKVIEEAHDLWARIFQHEIDHLNGLGCIDHMDMKTAMTTSEFRKRILKKK